MPDVLLQYEWVTSPFPHWRLPGVSGGVDLRPLALQASQGGQAGYGFASREESISPAVLDEWAAKCGYRPQGKNRVDLLWDQLTNGSDPAGDEGPKPLMPGVGLQLW
jgi:hypothetical protein